MAGSDGGVLQFFLAESEENFLQSTKVFVDKYERLRIISIFVMSAGEPY